MPLLDHFHPPLSERRHWKSFHGRWAAALMDALNGGGLPTGYFAEMDVSRAGGRVEVDVGSLDERTNGLSAPSSVTASGGVATINALAWAPPAPALELPAIFPEEIETVARKLGSP
jgi:hypothetical protein